VIGINIIKPPEIRKAASDPIQNSMKTAINETIPTKKQNNAEPLPRNHHTTAMKAMNKNE
jgi:hypothetical protein